MLSGEYRAKGDIKPWTWTEIISQLISPRKLFGNYFEKCLIVLSVNHSSSSVVAALSMQESAAFPYNGKLNIFGFWTKQDFNYFNDLWFKEKVSNIFNIFIFTF